MKRESHRSDEGAPSEASLSMNDRHQIVDLDFLRGLIAAVDSSGIDSLEISRGGTRIRVSKSASGGPFAGFPVPAPPPAASHPASPPAPAGAGGHVVAHVPAAESPAGTAAAKSNLVEIKSPMVGTFYRSPNPDAPAYVEVGSKIVKGQTLCILEAMKLMNELEAEVEGVVREVCVENAEPVEYGQVLFRIDPAA